MGNLYGEATTRSCTEYESPEYSHDSINSASKLYQSLPSVSIVLLRKIRHHRDSTISFSPSSTGSEERQSAGCRRLPGELPGRCRIQVSDATSALLPVADIPSALVVSINQRSHVDEQTMLQNRLIRHGKTTPAKHCPRPRRCRTRSQA